MPDLIRHPVFLDIFWIPGRALLARNDGKGNYSKLSLIRPVTGGANKYVKRKYRSITPLLYRSTSNRHKVVDDTDV
jgi:hypothetical protein